ncbi:response regulator [Chitinophaga filiformis]|uniref:Response regulator receiver domain-containing protein n=1 Tax=Chitinophaga filiformis TaxID=104663 RepID=A0A1G7TQA6_CHIFI|nr:response regulator [Chitinophaga filiformis]SDG37517.1 Response regulator receiver domain-containing protein [Chitinophaga filiformis]
MGKLNILIAENDANGKVLIQESFADTGLFNVVAVAEDGKILKDIMEESDILFPDVILSAAGHGYDVLYYIKRSDAFREIPVVTYSTSDSGSEEQKCQQMGALKHFIKPDNAPGYQKMAKELYDLLLGE